MPEGQNGIMTKGMKMYRVQMNAGTTVIQMVYHHPFDDDRNRECKDKGDHDNLLVLTDHF